MTWVQPKFTPAGQVIVSPMVGPWEQYPKGSPKWAEALAAHLQGACRRTQDKTDPGRITIVLKEALFSEPPPWDVWPEEAKGNPEAWVRMVTLQGWKDVEHIVTTRLGRDAWEPFRRALATWEATHRTPEAQPREAGRFAAVSGTYDGDATEARGILRRLAKRANAGDGLAAELIDQVSEGRLTVNQAAIEAGMRQRYFRVPDTGDLSKVAAALRKHFADSQIIALCEELLGSSP